MSGKQFGLLYIHQGTQRPVFCIRDAGSDLKEGDIYYRYRGRTTRIKYPELRSIIEEQRQSDQKLWLQHLAKISRVGVRDAGIFNLRDGKVAGPNGTFVIDESLLSQLAFIKEGRFTESKGKPAVRLVGEVKAVSGPIPAVGHSQVIRTKGIRLSDIVLAFLDHQKVDDPAEYIRQICFENTAFLPVYYFMNKAKKSIPESIELIEGVLSRSPARKKLLERIRNGKIQKERPPSEMSPTYEKKIQFLDDAKKHRLDRNIQGSDLRYCLAALRSLDESTVKKHSKYIRGLLKEWFNKHYMSADGYIAGNLRRTICWIDEALYLKSVK
ncbi:hypothetical protein DRO91_08580 [Candidatus Heimdallarchaeota archaeon]|nr:MAG: hypothetical protein DRO91_08580 [Candidatus Heimdallarchaeota archaeon]